MGELRGFYRRGAIAFVGGSLAPGRGGQSPAEPALVDVPVLIGPHHENQQEMVSSLVSLGGARIVKNSVDIVSECSKWLATMRRAKRQAAMPTHLSEKRRRRAVRLEASRSAD